MALAHGLRITRSRAVRESEWPVDIRRTDDAAAALAAVLTEDRALDSTGTIAVIASESLIDSLLEASDLGDAAGRGAEGLSRSIAFMTPSEVKGLEFDTAIIVEPTRIVDEIERGASALYVAMTRPTQRLYVIASTELPTGL